MSMPTLKLARHRLVWLAPHAWPVLLAQVPRDAEARAVVAHWASHHLPLVVCRQPEHLGRPLVALGLPAPARWSRRKLAFQVAPSHFSHSGAFPSLQQVARRFPWRQPGQALARRLSALGTPAQVFGSHGWQVLTGLPCLRESSDLDLRVEVESLQQADAVAAELAAAQLPCRIDGELVFGGDHAVAWREFTRWRAGETRQLLCKWLHGVALLDHDAMQALCRPLAPCGASPGESVACAA